MDGNTLAFIIALAKKISLQNGSIGVSSIDSNNGNLIFHLANGQSYTVTLPIPQIDLDNVMKITNYDKDKDGIIDKCDYANVSKKSEHSKTSDMANNSKYSVSSDDSTKLNGELAENYFNKVTNNSDNIIEGDINKFLSKDEKAKLNQLPTNINDLLNKKMNIDKYDSNNDGIIDIAKTLDGLQVKINEINQLQGTKDNIQKQIDSLSNIGNFTGSADTYKDITIVNPKPIEKDMIIVIKDETHQNTSTIYMYNGTQWVYSGTFTATVRDFATNPLSLDTETKGILPQSKIDLTGIAKTNEINNKIDKVQGNINNIITFNTNGDIKDSGINISDILSKQHTHNDTYYTKGESDNKYVTKNELKEQIQNIDIESVNTLQNDVIQMKNNISTLQQDVKTNILSNKSVLEKFSDDGTGLKYNGKEIENTTSGSGSIELDNIWSKFEL